MIECPSCKELELVGAIYCRRCGSRIIIESTDAFSIPKVVKPEASYKPSVYASDNSFSRDEPSNDPGKPVSENYPTPPTIKASQARPIEPAEGTGRLSLLVQQTGQLIEITENEEITLGRAGAGQPIVPDIDLTPYQGLEAGVSRLHASIRIKDDDIYIMDLGSANGTRLNGEKISPSTPHKLTNENIITLGKLNLKVLIKS